MSILHRHLHLSESETNYSLLQANNAAAEGRKTLCEFTGAADRPVAN